VFGLFNFFWSYSLPNSTCLSPSLWYARCSSKAARPSLIGQPGIKTIRPSFLCYNLDFSGWIFPSHDFPFRLQFHRLSSKSVSICCVGFLPLQGIFLGTLVTSWLEYFDLRSSLFFGSDFGTSAKYFGRNLRLTFTLLWSSSSVLQLISEPVKDHSTLIGP
jgi:hypothetical protein